MNNVMDHLRNSATAVDVGNGFGLHHGWVYSHPAGRGRHSCGDTVDQWPSDRLKDHFQWLRPIGLAIAAAH
jgi:hypothetical protein